MGGTATLAPTPAPAPAPAPTNKPTTTTKPPSTASHEAETIQQYSDEKITGFLSIPLVKQIADLLIDGFYYFLYMTLLYVFMSLVSYRYSNSTEGGSKMIIMIIVFAMGLSQPAYYRYQGLLKWYENPPPPPKDGKAQPRTDDEGSGFKWSLFLLFLLISGICVWNYFKNDGDTKYLLDIDDEFEVDISLSADIANAFINIKSSDPIASLDKFIIGGIIIQLIVMSVITITSNKNGKKEEEDLKNRIENAMLPWKD